jgi:4-hydroxy-tetrahydrodipicolinate synthase
VFRGAYTALITPFRQGAVDEAALRRLVEAQIAAGIDGLVPCGTTGESPTLTHAEHVRVIEIVADAAAGRVPVVAGAGSNCTATAIEFSRECKRIGVAGTLQITPYYNKPTQEGLYAHFVAIAEASGLPMIVYNVPGRTSSDLLAETVARLARHELVAGIKEATADMVRASTLRELCGPDFDLLSGDDATLLPFLAVGGNGVISVGSNVAPQLFARLCSAAKAGRWDEARELHYRHLPLTRALFSVANPIPVKTAMARLGKCAPEIRPPLHLLADDSPELAELEAQLRNLELYD